MPITMASDEMIYSNYFDLGMVMDYWGPERLNHHTEATSALFAARECARLILQGGTRQRHRPPQTARRCAAEGHPGDGARDLWRPAAQNE